ncbi:MAG: hypothetical protein IPK61_09950 [Saprospiraceae bacterium]|nr:hypothetical protein [Saprospiraceae bacterium]
MHYCSIVPEEFQKTHHALFGTSVGTGPFQLQKWLGKQGMFLKKMKTFTSKVFKVEGIRISFIEDRTSAHWNFQGKIDFFSGIHSGLQVISLMKTEI